MSVENLIARQKNELIVSYSKLEESLKTLPKHESQAYLRECFVNFIKSL